MKRAYFLLLFIISISASAQKIPFQGRLLDTGAPFNGVANLDFSIASPAWSESIPNVTVTDGYYSVVLGEITPLPDSLFSDSPEVILNISVNGQALSPVTLYSPFLPFTGANPVQIDTLESYEVRALGENDNPKVILGASANGYEGVFILRDSVNTTAAFIQSDGNEITGYTRGYMQINGRDNGGNLRSAVVGAGSVQGRANSILDLYGENSTADGAQLLVDLYASDIDLNGPIPDGYRRGGVDFYNYFGNPTHNIFSEHIGTSSISHLNLNASIDGGGPLFNVNLNSGDGATTGGSLSLRNFDGATGVNLDGTNMGTVNVGEHVFLFGDFNATGAGGIDVTDAGGLLRAQVNGPGGRIDVFGPLGSNNVAMRGRGDGDFGYVEMFNDLGEVRAEVGSFGDNSGFLILYGPNGQKNVQLDRDPANTNFGQFSLMDDLGATQIIATAGVSGGSLSVVGGGSIDLDGTIGNITASGNIGGNTLSSTDGSVQASDRRLKKNIKTLENPLANTLKMRGVSYQWKDKDKSQRNQIGVIAQEVEAIYPEFVHTNTDGIKAVNYAQMTAVLIEAVKELNAKVEKLETENSELKASLSEVETLRKEMDHLIKVLGSSKAASK